MISADAKGLGPMPALGIQIVYAILTLATSRSRPSPTYPRKREAMMVTADSGSGSGGADLLAAMLARRAVKAEEPVQAQPEPEEENPPIDALTENLAYHMRRWNKQAEPRAPKAIKPEASVLKSIKTWLKKITYIDTKRVSVGKMRNQHGFMMNFGGQLGESDLVLTPHAGQPFERQIHVEVKRPDVIIDGKKVQRAGKQSDNQKRYQEQMEARGDKYVVVTSVNELAEFLSSLGFENLPKVGR